MGFFSAKGDRISGHIVSPLKVKTHSMTKYCKALTIYFLICLGEISKYPVPLSIDLKNLDVSLSSIKVT